MATPADSPPPRSRWHDWWKFPLFFGVVIAAIALEAVLNTKGAVLLLLVVAYVLVRGVGALVRLARKR
jgi:hypothetical protein